jgi:pimeloyl-ACP methyl ester carboxylesterase
MTAVVLIVGTLLGVTLLLVAALALFAAYTARRVIAIVPATGSFVDVAGARIHYVEAGRGPTLLMIHGLGGQGRNFTHSIVDLLKDDFHVVVMDRPGSGHSTRHVGAPAHIRAHAKTVADFIRTLGLKKPVVVGHSLGGAIALALAVDHPELVGALALVAPLTQLEHEPPAPFAPLMIQSPLRRHLTAWTIAIPAGILRGRTVLEKVFAPDPVPADYAVAGGGLLGLRPSAFYATSTDLVSVNEEMPSIIARYGSLRLPVWILFGRDDRILDYHRHGEVTIAQIPGARLELTDGGHMLPLTAPDRVAAFVREVAGESERGSLRGSSGGRRFGGTRA